VIFSLTFSKIDWKLYNLSGDSSSQQDFFNISFAEPKAGTGDLVSLVWDPIPPEESTNGPFTISPMYFESHKILPHHP